MRPTGKLHLGHLVGALDNWVKLQDEYDCFFMAADWHALMSEYENPASLGENIIDNVADWIACGVSPEKSVLFIQSQVKEHLELYMIFSMITQLGALERCPTYKEQLREASNRDLHTYAFLGYPVLQAADILMYKAQAVPVGQDQLPHLELTRQIARKFNNLCKKEIFPDPRALLTNADRLPGLDGRKMSKSYNNSIALCEEPDSVRRKIMNMITDPARIKLTDPGHPDICGVHAWYAVFAPHHLPQIDGRCRNAEIGCTDCKKELAEILIALLEPIQEKRRDILKDKNRIFGILENGRAKAQEIARTTAAEAKELMGLVSET